MVDSKYASFEMLTEDILKVSFSDQDPSEAEFEEYLDELEKYLASITGLVLIIDATNASYLSGRLRIRQGNWIKEHTLRIREAFVKWCYVINSPIVKFLLQGIFLIQKPPVAYTFHTSLAEAVAEAKNSQLAYIRV